MDAANPRLDYAPAPPPVLAPGMVWLYLIESMATIGGTLMSIGIFFFMKYRFGWQMPQNFMLAAAQGLVYIPGALGAGPIAARFGPRRTLTVAYAALTLLTAAAFALARTGGPAAAAGVVAALLAYTFTIGISWPILEGLVASGGPASGIARRLAIYNILWPAGGALAIAVEGTILDHWVGGLFLIPGALHFASLALLAALRTRAFLPPLTPGEGWGEGKSEKSFEQQGESFVIPPHPNPLPEGEGIIGHPSQFPHPEPEPELLRKRTLALWLSRTALPATYTVIYGLMPMMPSLPTVKPLPTATQTVVASVWLMTRWLAFVILALGTWWHTRPRALLWAAVVMGISFFGMTLRPTGGASPTVDLVSMIAWQALLGLAIGMIYAGSLYFGMVLSDGSTEHGGYHEALIGLGWILGPAAGAGAQAIRPDNLWLGITAVGSVIGLSVLAVLLVAAKLRRES
jgi:MFS family permease